MKTRALLLATLILPLPAQAAPDLGVVGDAGKGLSVAHASNSAARQ